MLNDDWHSVDDSEEATLLAHAEKDYGPAPLPKAQVGIVLLLEFCEPITNQSISPYISQLISELDITGGDERKVGYYVGLLQSLSSLTEIIMGMQWSRISDHVGRKPVLLIGLMGISASILLFGLSRTFWTLAFRCHEEYDGGAHKFIQSRSGFSLMLAIWAAGATLGSLIGGTFARPHERFPQVFREQFWQDYPYFLPCLVTSSFVCISFVIAFLFLEETVPKRIRDRHRFSLASRNVTPVDLPHSEPLPLYDLLVYPVIISVSNYTALIFLNTMLDALLPLFLAMPIHIGGLGFKPSTIGYIMGSFGVIHADILLFPVMNSIAQRSGINLVVCFIIIVLLSLMIFMNAAYGCIFIYITTSSPNKRSLGATNGLSQMSASVAGTVAPVLATSLFSLSVERNLLGGYAVYAVLFCISSLAIFLAVLLPEKVWEEKDDDDVELSDCCTEGW
ncbi:major facilitator superfamily domain-containing protein [Infundibulicybe gibba]|nr:major facilitator superfamily domain-containing protein [Infundibulicybe gibba]